MLGQPSVVSIGSLFQMPRINSSIDEQALTDVDTFSGPLLLQVLRTFEAFSLNLSELLQAVDLGLEDLQHSESRVSAATVDALWRLAEKKSGKSNFGLEAAKILEAKHLGLFGYVVISSANVREAMERLVRFKTLTGDASAVNLQMSEEGMRYIHTTTMPPLSLNRIHAEWSLAGMVRLLRVASGKVDWSPLAITFKHKEPNDLSLYHEIFGYNVLFGCPEESFLVEPSFLEVAFEGTDSTLSGILETHATQLLLLLPEQTDFVRTVQRRLQKQLPGGNPSIEMLAENLGLSVRSLQRRLEDQGQTFQTVLDDIRVRLADVYLEEASTSISEVAFLLGYSGASAFARAFKRWRLVSPTEWRSARQTDAQLC